MVTLKQQRNFYYSIWVTLLAVLIFTFQNCAESSLVLPEAKEKNTQKAACVGPQGEAIADGEVVSGYFAASTVSCSEACVEKVMTCSNGTLMGNGGEILADSLSLAASSCQAVCDNRNISGNEVTSMQSGKPYLVSVYGVTANKGTGNTNLQPVRVETCGGQALAASQVVAVNWHDGSAPQSHTFSITAPADGCIRGFVDGNDSSNALNMTVSEQKETGTNSTTNQLTGLQANSKYLVNVYGMTRNRGQDNATLDPVGVNDCAGNSLVATDVPTINWPDGNVPHSMSLIASAPADGCVQGTTDGGAANAKNLSSQKAVGDARTVTGSQVNNLVAGKNYFVSVYGLTTQITNEAATDILDGVKVTTCNDQVLAETQSTTINWHDGSAPQNASLVIKAPADGCIKAVTDGGPARVITVFEVN